MRIFRPSASSAAAGVLTGVLIVILPVFLLGAAQDLAVAIWLPGTWVVGKLGGGGLHDPGGLLYLIAGLLVDLSLYALLATAAIEYLRRRKG